ncbi:MAG TPA: hypothetical protein PLD88_10785 [Candidatus Berkiella sp.]|nr:hypothetical protein [Candidatus Berkiella sp.]
MLFSGQKRKELPKVDQLLKQAEAGTSRDPLLIENGQQLVVTPDRVLAPFTESSIKFEKEANRVLSLLNSTGATSKPK